MSDLLTTAQPPQPPLNVLAFTPTGGLIALAGLAFLTLLGPYLLPKSCAAARADGGAPDRQRPGGGVPEPDERLWEVQVPAASSMVGRTLTQTDIGDRLGLTVAAIWRGQQALFAPRADYVLQGGDILLTVGREERITQLAQEGLKVGRNGNDGSISRAGRPVYRTAAGAAFRHRRAHDPRAGVP